MVVKCTNPDCKSPVSEYRGDFIEAARPRKVCPSCGRKFDVKGALYDGPISDSNGPFRHAVKTPEGAIGSLQANTSKKKVQNDEGPNRQNTTPAIKKPIGSYEANKLTPPLEMDHSQLTPPSTVPGTLLPVFEKLDPKDVRIVKQLINGATQADIARTENMSRASVHRRVQTLVKIGLLREDLTWTDGKTWPRAYSLPDELKDLNPLDLKAGIRFHDVNVRHEITVKTPKYQELLPKLKHWKVKNWYNFELVHPTRVKVIISETLTPNVHYKLQVAGRTPQELQDNLDEKILKIKDYVEETLHLRLSDPTATGNGGVDVVAGIWTDEEMTKFKAAYCKSDPDAIGEGRVSNLDQAKAQAKLLMDAMHGNQAITKEIEQVKTDVAGKFDAITSVLSRMDANTVKQADTMEKMVQSMQTLSDLQLKMGQAIMAINATLAKFTSGSQESSSRSTPDKSDGVNGMYG